LDERLASSIDLNKNCLESLKDIYKVLISIGKLQYQQEIARNNATQCFGVLASMYKIGAIESEDTIVKHYNAMLLNYNSTILERYTKRDFSNIFEKYIRA
jgi:hypothetical protein